MCLKTKRTHKFRAQPWNPISHLVRYTGFKDCKLTRVSCAETRCRKSASSWLCPSELLPCCFTLHGKMAGCALKKAALLKLWRLAPWQLSHRLVVTWVKQT